MSDRVKTMAAIAMLLSGSVVRSATVSPYVLDDFEDGSDSGWRVVGHGPAMAEYSKRLVSPGWQSVYALSLLRQVAVGWCGLAAPDPARLGLRQCEGIQVAARTVRGVPGLIVDAHLADGSRWWYKASLPADGSWIILLGPTRYLLIDS